MHPRQKFPQENQLWQHLSQDELRFAAKNLLVPQEARRSRKLLELELQRRQMIFRTLDEGTTTIVRRSQLRGPMVSTSDQGQKIQNIEQKEGGLESRRHHEEVRWYLGAARSQHGSW